MDINAIITKICNKYNVEHLNIKPEKMSGGFLHFVYKISTLNGEYIIKILNPDIMKREQALDNFKKANALENLIKKHNINAIYFDVFDYIILDNKKYYFYIYKYYDGKSIFDEKITRYCGEKIGEELAKIHNIKIEEKNTKFSEIYYDWEFYVKAFENNDKEIYLKLKQNKDTLYYLCNKYNENISNLPNLETICHNDLDPKNVLWKQHDFKIIDLECLCYFNPYLELLETILQWSGINIQKLNKSVFNAFKTSYFKHSNINLNIDWNVVYYCNINMINWLEYNLKKYTNNSFNLESEKLTTKSEIINSLNKINYYYNQKSVIINLIK